ncbi:DUF262 domain-containing protein [Devosia sp. A16]|uniref:DUF262 domain-containing protein n=1 Tax=Devosia sp. A16 TaxID=1736675 RepID=UPI0006D7E5F2|nr:DUF262 domain-containing protein [Devosia sp. A16]
MAKKIKSNITAEQIAKAEEAISAVSRQVRFTIVEYPISVYVSRFGNDTDDRYFVPEYQRNAAWNDEQKSQFIESLLVGLPIPFMFFYQTPVGRMEIVDGSQRMRAMRSFIKESLRLKELVLVPELNGFRFGDLPQERRNKLEDFTIRTIVLDTDTDPSTRAEMFARINRAGTAANEAEIRRGSLPGPMTDLIKELAESAEFAAATPISDKAVDQREREELVTRFFAYTDTSDAPDGRFLGYRDRPKKFLYDYLKGANERAKQDASIIEQKRAEFFRVLDFVANTFPLGFRRNGSGPPVPRVRFEAIAVGSALALRQMPNLHVEKETVARRMTESGFDKIVVSDGANVRAKLEGRIDLAKNILLQQ